MKKIILIIGICLTGLAYAQSNPQTETKLSSKKTKLYKEHKKELMDNNKKYQDEKRSRGVTSDFDSQDKTNGEVVDFSTGKPVKK